MPVIYMCTSKGWQETNGPCHCDAAAVAGLLFVLHRRKKQRVDSTDATSSADSVESRKGLSTPDGEVDPSEFVFCRNADGSKMCLGEGNFGKARTRPWSICFGKSLLRPRVRACWGVPKYGQPRARSALPTSIAAAVAPLRAAVAPSQHECLARSGSAPNTSMLAN
jgi:hypothetical protein